MHRVSYMPLVILLGILGTGCSMVAPKYSASIENVQKLKDGGNYTAKVGTFTSKSDPANANPISMRGSSLASPYEESYANYLAEAIKSELVLAGKLAPGSNVEISGVLLKNDIDAGMSVGTGDIQARFLVKRDGQIRYDQVKTAQNKWESSFAAAVALPRAVQEYPRMVQALLSELYTDKAFLQALK
jgi:hypothetical protein